MKNNDFGLLLIRIVLAVVILPHGIDKLVNGLDSVEALLAMHNLPTFLAYGVLVGEIVAPLMLLVGFHTQIAAGIVAINMVVALALAHTAELFTFSGGAWAIELQALMLFVAVAICFTGPGAYRWKH